MRFVPLMLAVAALLACGGSSAPGTLDGTWNRQGGMMGSGSTMTLTQIGDSVSGNGVQKVEAGTDRPFRVTGSYSAGSFNAVFTFTADASQESYQATVDGNTMSGVVSVNGTPSELDFTRQ